MSGPSHVKTDLAIFGGGFVIWLGLIAGCSTTPPVPTTDTHVVSVPVIVACSKDVPPLPTPTQIDLTTATPKQKAAAVSVDAEEYQKYAKAAAAALAKCSQGDSK